MNLFPHPLSGTPFGVAVELAVIFAATCWLLSILTREYSWIDRIWTLCPPLYCLIVAWDANFTDMRINIMTVLVFLWGARLTYNMVRKGGYWKGGEDYRWAHVKERTGKIGFQLLNITFVAPGQMLVVLWFTSPIHQAWLAQSQPLTVLDGVAIVIFLAFWVIEAITDEQMWKFQQDKKRRIEHGESVDRPFITSGFFQYVRHPSYTCEMGMWIVFYFFGVAATGQWVHWSGIGFILLIAVFFGSTRLAESISLQRYPSYREYQESTPKLIPFTRIGCVKPV